MQKLPLGKRVAVFCATLIAVVSWIMFLFWWQPRADGHHDQWRNLVEEYFPPDEVGNALAVIECESRGDPAALNSNVPIEHSVGLFQINVVAHHDRIDEDSLYVPFRNVEYAAQLHQQAGWAPWSCSRVLAG